MLMYEQVTLVCKIRGDGNCAPRAASAYLFGGKEYGREMRKEMNKHIVKE